MSKRPADIETERLLLVCLLPEEIERLVAGDHERVSLLTGIFYPPDDPNRDVDWAWHLRALQADCKQIGWRVRVVVERSSNTVIGSINLKGSPIHGDVEIGWCLQADARGKGYQSSINNILSYFGRNIRLSEITVDSIFRFQQARLEQEAGKATVNRDVATLSSCLSRAKKMRLTSHNPCSDVGKLNERRDRRRARPLSYDEEDRVKDFSPPLLRMLITLLADTGLRVRKEALPLRWTDVLFDSEPACIRIRDSKSAAGVRAVWLTNHCRDALMRWRELFGPEHSAFVFPSPRNPNVHFVDYKTAWRSAVRKAGLADRRIYDLRATFASRANVCHATGLTVAHLLGHASTQILPTYVRPFDDNTRALIEAMDKARKTQRVRSGSIN